MVLERAAQAPEQLSRWQAMLVPAAAHTYWQAMLVLVLVPVLVLVLVRVAATVPGAQATAPAMAQMSVRRLGKAHVQLLN